MLNHVVMKELLSKEKLNKAILLTKSHFSIQSMLVPFFFFSIIINDSNKVTDLRRMNNLLSDMDFMARSSIKIPVSSIILAYIVNSDGRQHLDE